MDKEPWEEAGWSKSKYFSFIRSNLRKMTMRWPVKQKYLSSLCRPAPKGSRFKYVCNCEQCGVELGKSKAEIDHIIPAGSLKGYEDLPGFVSRLLCTSSNLRLLCHDCHAVYTLADRKGITFEEATQEKEVIAFTKLPVVKQKRLLKRLEVKDEDMSNQDKRTNAYRKTRGN
jgi:5-methylcytosine-specific restriction endonuclease McrA